MLRGASPSPKAFEKLHHQKKTSGETSGTKEGPGCPIGSFRLNLVKEALALGFFFGAILFIKIIYSSLKSEKPVSKGNCKMVIIFCKQKLLFDGQKYVPFRICGQETYSWLNVGRMIGYPYIALDG